MRNHFESDTDLHMLQYEYTVEMKFTSGLNTKETQEVPPV